MWRRQARSAAAAILLLGLALSLLAGPAAALPALQPQGEQMRQQDSFRAYREEPLEPEEGPSQQGLGGGQRDLEVLGSRLFLRPMRGGPDALSGVAFGSSKRFDPLSGAVFGHQKRNFDEIDRLGFNAFVKRNFDEIDRSGFGSFVKRNFDEIDRAGFGSFVKRNAPNLLNNYYEKQDH